MCSSDLVEHLKLSVVYMKGVHHRRVVSQLPYFSGIELNPLVDVIHIHAPTINRKIAAAVAAAVTITTPSAGAAVVAAPHAGTHG